MPGLSSKLKSKCTKYMMRYIIVAILVFGLSFQGLYFEIAEAAPDIPVTGVRVSPVELTLGIDTVHRLTVTVLPANATNRNVTWSSNNTSIATVDSTGLVRAHAIGEAEITVRSDDGGFTDTSNVRVVISVTGIKLTPSSTSINVADSFQLNAEVEPSNANNRDVIWSSGNEAVATVDSAGLVIGRTAGTAIITAATREGGFTAASTITVSNVSVTGVSVTPTLTNVSLNRSIQLTATVSPNNATNKNVIWSSSNTSIAAVDSTGLVTGRGIGSATITARTAQGNHIATSTVNVSSVAVTGVSVAPVFATMIIGETSRLNATIIPHDASDTRVSWTSSNPSVATVDSTGLVTARAVGEAAITATTLDGNRRSSSIVTVGSRVTGVTLTPSTIRFRLTDPPQQLTARVVPADAQDRRVTWTSSNAAVATVDIGGRVTRTGNSGTAVITARTVEGGFTATSNVLIIAVPVTGVTLAPATVPPINVGATQQLTANVLPANATDRSVTWSSGNPSVATVSDAGLVRGISGGSAAITVTTNDGGLTATANITINVISVTGVTLAPATANLNIGATQQLTANVAPANASNRNVSWSSSDTSIAAVSNTGFVTALRAGTATITVRTEDGGRTATSAITVTFVPVTGVTLGPARAAINAAGMIQLNATIAPATASNRELTWSSSNNSVAIVSPNGLVFGIGQGSATITVRTVDGAFTATSEVTVTTVAVTSVTLTPASATINVGSSQQLTATVEPVTATNRNVIWSSSNTSVATVTNAGLVAGIRAGVATITARTEDGGRTAQSTITVIGIGPPLQDQARQTVERNRNTMIEIEDKIQALFPPNSVTGLMPEAQARIITGQETDSLFAISQRQNLTALTDIAIISLSGGELDTSVRVTMNFDSGRVAVGRMPALFGFNDRTNRWIYIDAQRGAGQLTASVEWLSAFAVFASEPLPAMNDIANHWARNPIVTLAGMDILGGYPDGSFRPDTNVTRAEFAAMLSRAVNLSSRPQAADRFTDAAGFDWAKGAIGATVEAGLMGGLPDGTFGAARGISRAEIAVILERVVNRGHVRVRTAPNAVSFADNIPAWARAGVQFAASTGILRGFADNTFRPERIATRAEVAAILYRLIAED